MLRSRVGLGALVLVTLTCVAPRARAQSAVDAAAAEVLFDQGRALMEKGDFAAACPKLAESNRLDAGIGTMLYLADCYEKSGRFASAWGEYRSAASLAEKQHEARAEIAKRAAAAIEPKLSKLVIHAPSSAPEITITRDGDAVSNALLDVDAPVDSGVHVIEARAPGKKAWKTSVTLAVGSRIVVDVPELAPEGPAEVEPPPAIVKDHAEPLPEPQKRSYVPAITAGAVGVVGLGVAAAFGAIATHKRGVSDAGCPNGQCTQSAASANSDARSAAWVADVGLGVGVIGLGIGTYLLSQESPEPRRAVGYASIGMGVVALGTGVALGVRALSKRSDSNTDCPNNVCTMQGVYANDEAKAAAWGSDVGIALGVVGIAAGAFLVATSGHANDPTSASTNSVHVTPMASRSGFGLGLRRDW